MEGVMFNFFRRLFKGKQSITAGRDCVAVCISGNGNTTRVSSGPKGSRSEVLVTGNRCRVIIDGEVVYDGKRQDSSPDRP